MRGVMVAVCAALLLSGCSAFSSDGDTPASDEVRVAASFYPLAYVAERVGECERTRSTVDIQGHYELIHALCLAVGSSVPVSSARRVS